MAKRASDAGLSTGGPRAKGRVKLVRVGAKSNGDQRHPSAALGRSDEDDDLVLGHAIEQGVGLLVQKILVDTFRPQARDA